MTRALCLTLLCLTGVALLPASATAQNISQCKKKMSVTPTASQPAPDSVPAGTDAPTWIAKADAASPYVTLECDATQLFADVVEYYETTNVVKARGHVTFIDGDQRMSADHIEFNVKTKLGKFWQVQGVFGVTGKATPQSALSATNADAFFDAETVEIVAKNTLRMTNGRFTTCVQATPRWSVEGAEMFFVKDRYAVVKSHVLKIKDVPVLYLPWMRYPINKEERSTGILMPNYGNSTLRGQTISSGFFWAINRSMDATLHYEYASKAGQGYGLEYRYVQAPGSEGSFRGSLFNGSGEAGSVFSSRTFQISSAVVQQLPGSLDFRGIVDYTSNILTQQVTQQSLTASTNSTRSANFNLRGNYGRLLASTEAGFTDVFFDSTTAIRTGNAPRLNLTFAQAPIGPTKIYFGATAEYAGIIRQNKIGDPTSSLNVGRVDFNPILRTPIGNLPFLGITTTIGYRYTRWSDRLVTSTTQAPIPITRNLFDFRADVAGPTFTRIFDTPNSDYATRWKHIIQPNFSISKTTTFEEFNLVPKNDGVDMLYGGVTSMAYGLTNRLLAKRPSATGGPAAAQEIASVQVQQTYYTNAAASLFDTNYQSSIYGAGTSKFSPIAVTATVQPATGVNITGRTEYDMTFRAIRSTSAGAGINVPLLTLNATWAKQDTLSKDPKDTTLTIKTGVYHSLITSVAAHTSDRRFNASWSWSYDLQRAQQLQQRYTFSYMAQCCGLAMEYQIYNFGGLAVSGITQDKRFNLSFSLAGVGTFANLLGAFGR